MRLVVQACYAHTMRHCQPDNYPPMAALRLPMAEAIRAVRQGLIWALLAGATGLIGCRQETAGGSPAATTVNPEPSTSPVDPVVPQVLAAAQLPEETISPTGFATATGTVRVAAYYRSRKPSCSPCPPGARCEPCPLPFHQLSDVSARVRAFAGTVVYAEFVEPSPQLSVDEPYVFEGTVANATYDLHGESGTERVLHVDKIYRLSDPTAIGAQLSTLNLDRTCTNDADCRIPEVWPQDFERCCEKCPSDAVSESAANLVVNICTDARRDDCPNPAACARGTPRCDHGRCRAVAEASGLRGEEAPGFGSGGLDLELPNNP